MGAETTPWRITVIQPNGNTWCISSPNPFEMGAEGVTLCSDPKGFYDAPFKTLRNSTAYQEGATYGGAKYDARDQTWKVRFHKRGTESKMEIESRWRRGWSPSVPCIVRIEDIAEGTTRDLLLQLESTPEFVSPTGRDPGLMPHLDVIMSTVSYWPFATSEPQEQTWESTTFVPDPQPNKVTNPSFDANLTGWDAPGWVRDPAPGHTGAASVTTTANGTTRSLTSNSVAANAGATWVITAWAKWSGVTGSGANVVRVEVEARNGGTVLDIIEVGTLALTASSDWTQITDDVVLPANTANIKVRIVVPSGVTAGSVFIDDVTAYAPQTYTATGTVTVWNPTDRKLYPFWTLSAEVPTAWTVPDYSFGDDYWDLAVEHADRMVALRQVDPGQELTVDTYPRNERINADDESLQWARQNGIDFLYAVPPYTPPTELTIKATVVNTTQPVGAVLLMRRNWSRPWGLIDPAIPLELEP